MEENQCKSTDKIRYLFSYNTNIFKRHFFNWYFCCILTKRDVNRFTYRLLTDNIFVLLTSTIFLVFMACCFNCVYSVFFLKIETSKVPLINIWTWTFGIFYENVLIMAFIRTPKPPGWKYLNLHLWNVFPILLIIQRVIFK